MGILWVEGIFGCHSSSYGSRGPYLSSIRSLGYLGMDLGALVEEGVIYPLQELPHFVLASKELMVTSTTVQKKTEA